QIWMFAHEGVETFRGFAVGKGSGGHQDEPRLRARTSRVGSDDGLRGYENALFDAAQADEKHLERRRRCGWRRGERAGVRHPVRDLLDSARSQRLGIVS